MIEGALDGPDAAKVDFFVSHAGRDQAWAEWVAWHLREAGYTLELACWDWAAGENFVKRMYGALEAANRVVALFSSAYFEDPRYTTEEWTSALVRSDEGKHRLMPVQIEPCRVPQLLNSLVRIELFDVDETEAVRRLVAAAAGPTRPDNKPRFPGQAQAGALTGRGEEGPRRPGVMPSVWNVGPRNPRFVGRDGTLVHLRERFRSGGIAVVQALHGVGGVGKTQLAIEYAHRFAGAYDVVWWISAEEATLIGEQYAALAIELGLISRQADIVSAVGALRAYLRQHSQWLLLLDNVESPRELRDWLPAGPGHILITSHDPGWDELAAARVEVDVLPRPDSVELIHKYRPGAAEADRLAVALGDLPLALAQAAKFLAETGMSVDRYLELVETQTAELLNQSPPESHPHSLVAAIRVSTDRLAKVDPVALALVRIGAFLAPEPIPADVLTRPISATGENQPPELETLIGAVASPVAAHRSLGRVGSYGLARIDRGMQLHRLTLAILRNQLTSEHAAAYRAYAQALLVAEAPGDERDPAYWPDWARILPHLLATGPASSHRTDLRDLACRAAWYLYRRGDLHPARDLADRLRQQWRERLGPDDQHTLRVTLPLLRVLIDMGPDSHARQLGEDTFARCQRMFGGDHPDTLHAAHTLAICLYTMGAFEQAHQLNVDTLARTPQVFGDDHIDFQLTVAYNQGRILRELGEFEAARQLHEDCLAHRRQQFGVEHPFTIATVNELGRDLHALGQVGAARQLHKDGLARAQRVLGEDHPWTLDCANNLASDLHVLGAVGSARHLAGDTLARTRRVLGDESHLTMDAANTLATALHALGELEAARQLSEDTLVRARRVFGEDHPRTRKAADTFAAALRSSSEAEPATQGTSDPTDEAEPPWQGDPGSMAGPRHEHPQWEAAQQRDLRAVVEHLAPDVQQGFGSGEDISSLD